jgi:hypothetical protein
LTVSFRTSQPAKRKTIAEFEEVTVMKQGHVVSPEQDQGCANAAGVFIFDMSLVHSALQGLSVCCL